MAVITGVAPNTSRTFLARISDVNGFCRNPCSAPQAALGDLVVGVAGHEEHAQPRAVAPRGARASSPPPISGITTSVSSRSIGPSCSRQAEQRVPAVPRLEHACSRALAGPSRAKTAHRLLVLHQQHRLRAARAAARRRRPARAVTARPRRAGR